MYDVVARNAIKEIGFDSLDKGFDYRFVSVNVGIESQSN